VLAKIILTNLWPIGRYIELKIEKAQFMKGMHKRGKRRKQATS